MNNQIFSIEIDFSSPESDDLNLERETQILLKGLKELDLFDSVDRVLDPNPPQGNLSGGGWLPGLLKLALTPVNIPQAVGWLRQKFSKQPIKIKVKSARGDEYEIDVKNPDDLDRVAIIAQKLALGESVDESNNR